MDTFLLEGGLFFFTLLGAIGFCLQAFLAFTFWRNGEEGYFLKCISYTLDFFRVGE